MKAIPGGDHVDLNRRRRTDSALAARFRAFADLECAPAGSGMSVDSPTYALLARHVATRGPLLALARECRPGQPIPNLLFAAVKRLVADEPDTPLAQFYGRAPKHGPSQELPHALNQFPVEARESFMGLLRSAAQSRPVFHVSSEGERVDVVRMEGDGSTTLLSVSRSAHGRWVQW